MYEIDKVISCYIFLLFSFSFGFAFMTDDPLSYPYYSYGTSTSPRPEAELEKCGKYPFGKMQNVKIPGHVTNISDSTSYKIVDVHHTTMKSGEFTWNQRDVLMHVMYVNDPAQTVSIYEPGQKGTCQQPSNVTRATVQETARNKNCIAAVNAGFFNTTSGKCLGNIVSDGRLVQDSEGIHNAHFGITSDGSLFFGYLSEIDVIAEDFIQLVGGVIWVLKEGEVQVEESIASECRDTEETGSLQRFADVISARTLVGHDTEGRLIVLQIDGKTSRNGASLYDAAKFLKDLGAINAVNLDGGGSTSLVINNTLVNYASDYCQDNKLFQCARKVTTVLCIHEPYCASPNCSGHGSCVKGQCHCHGNWGGIKCDHLECAQDCSGYGICREDGCFCLPGFYGDACQFHCPDGWYGFQCRQKCMCVNNGTCDTVNGLCQCLPGFTGKLCENGCSYGYYGEGCSSQCECDNECMCDPVTGSCNHTDIGEELIQAGTCIANKLLRQEKLEGDMMSEYRNAIACVIVLSVLASVSLVINAYFLWCYYTRWRHKNNSDTKYRKAQTRNNGRTFVFQQFANSSFTTSTSSDDEETRFVRIGKRKKKKVRK